MTDLRVDVDTVPLENLYPDPGNVRSHDDRNLEAIKASLRDFGQVEPLIADMDGKVLGGNARLEAMQALGWDEAQVVHLDIEEPEATKLALALNRTAELASWDEELARIVESLNDELELDPLWNDDEIDALLKDPLEPADEDEMTFEPAYEVIVVCDSESEQEQVYEDLTEKGYQCRLASM